MENDLFSIISYTLEVQTFQNSFEILFDTLG